MGARPPKRTVRGVAGLVLAIGVILLVGSALAAPRSQPGEPAETVEFRGYDGNDPTLGVDTGTGTASRNSSPASRARAVTVVTTQWFYTGAHPGARDDAELVAFDAGGSVIYHNATYQVYFDVDPVPGTRQTVEYVAAKPVTGSACGTKRCSLNLVERLNLTTGAVTRVYDAVTPQFESGRWHDVDRVNETHLVVADIVYDRVYVVDVRSDEVTWEWNASEHYPPDTGGVSGDWTHLNDVEVLPDGRIMASIRNMDSVVFLDPDVGVVDAWTLGTDDDHDILHEPHNPDYIPADRGGPAILVADSENNRVVEYRRQDGRWTPSWAWRDVRLQWPRDADRLASGHTLVVDSHGNRVVEVGTNGSVVWRVDIGRPYDAERLGTGDESAGGYAAGTDTVVNRSGGTSLRAPPATNQGAADGGDIVIALKDALPPSVVNGLLFVAPPWVGFTDLLVSVVVLLDLLAWGGFEWRWSGRSVRNGLRRLER